MYGYARSDLHQLEGNLDAVFVATYGLEGTDWVFGDRIYYSEDEYLRSGIDTNLAQGNSISKSGRKTKVTRGIVEYSSGAYDYDGEHFFDFGVANYDASNGDSGGIVYTTRSGNNWIAGIHTGTGFLTEPDDNRLHAVFCKAINITPTFGLSLY